ncbi:lipase, partial [Streptomyces rubellomurinus subsp. indigoferus]
ALAAGANYVALGHSYSAGVCAGSYPGDSGSCKRSTNAYADQWKNANAPSSFSGVPCSDAKTRCILRPQLSAMNAGTTLVILTIGGNDAGFYSTMQTCVLSSDSDRLNAVSAAESYAENT